jgi:acyl-CoA reductase-like NAD-dependent aldehyde dehydrogenase
VPDGVFNLLNGDGKVGKELVNTKGIAGVFFTGSVATGKAIARETIGKGNLIRLQLELGGKDAVYVRDDIKDIDAVAAAVLDGAMYNNGQGCCSVERVYVHEKIYSAFTAALVKHAKAASVGDCSDNNAYITRLARGKVHVDALNAQVEDAVKKNGVLLCGGVQKGDGGVFLPTIVGNATSDMLVMKEESFGPIFGVAPVANDDEAIEKINDSDYGLTASVYTSSNESAEKILQAANVGIAYRNCCDSVSVRMPWTGRKDSGIGSTCGVDGIRAFCYTKSYYLR